MKEKSLWRIKPLTLRSNQGKGDWLKKLKKHKHDYNSLAWKELRQKVLKRDEYTCQICGKTEQHLHIHHIVPKSRGGKDSLDNLIAVCKTCHERIHPHLKNITRRKKDEKQSSTANTDRKRARSGFRFL